MDLRAGGGGGGFRPRLEQDIITPSPALPTEHNILLSKLFRTLKHISLYSRGPFSDYLRRLGGAKPLRAAEVPAGGGRDRSPVGVGEEASAAAARGGAGCRSG